MPTPSIAKALLVSLSPVEGPESVIKAATVRITFRVLARSIDDLVRCELLPESDMSRNDLLRCLAERAERADSTTLFGLSVMSNDYPLFREVSALLRRSAPESLIVAGGPHFVDEYRAGAQRVCDDSTARRALRERLADVVVVGQGGALRKLILGLVGGDLRFGSPAEGRPFRGAAEALPEGGRCRTPDGGVVGHGVGKRPHVTRGNPYIVPVRYGASVGANYNLSNRCANNCAYCGSPKHGYDLPLDSYVEEMDRATAGERIEVLQANDNHPFEKRNRSRTFRLLELFAARHGAMPRLLNFFLDPSILLEPDSDDLRRFLEGLRGGGHQFQFGRECTAQSIADALGRRFRGKPRDQERLDRERGAILELARLLPDAQFKVFYIMTPFESRETVKATIEEARLLATAGNIYTGSNLLWPLPGSHNRFRYRGDYFSFDDVPRELVDSLEVLSAEQINFWSPSLPSSRLLSLLAGTEVKIFVDPLRPNNTSCHLALMEILAAVAFGSYREGATVPAVVEGIPRSGRATPGDMDPGYVSRLVHLGESIDGESLHVDAVANMVRLCTLVRELFWLWSGDRLRSLAADLERIEELRRTRFAT